MFYLSEFLKENRERYYQRLRAIDSEGGWKKWIEFFLEAIELQAISNSERVKGILALYNTMKMRVTEVTHSQYSPAILEAIFDRPIFSSADFIIRSEIPNATAKSALKKMREAGVLWVLRPASGSRAVVLAFADLLNLAEDRKVL